MGTNLILKIIPPIRPSFLHASLLLENGAVDNSAKHAEGHGNTVVVVAVNTHAFLQFRYRSSLHLETVVELLGLNSKLGYRIRQNT